MTNPVAKKTLLSTSETKNTHGYVPHMFLFLSHAGQQLVVKAKQKKVGSVRSG